MTGRAIDTYLNDHLAGAVFGSDLARQLAERTDGTVFGEAMGPLASDIEEDRETLRELMDRMGTSRNPVKQATTYVAEKVSRVKLTGLSAGEDEFGLLLALETLSLGVEGKASMWEVLRDVSDRYPALAETDFDVLLQRARRQREILEQERTEAGRRAFVEGDRDGDGER
ncbi:MAG TPA: hypothetical protein VGL51_07330 [Solirubrobacteraceae bacterium]|jgi:hypothetical protein